VKHILLAAGGPQGMLQLAPLYAELARSGAFRLTLLSSARPDAETAACFGLGEACRVVGGGSLSSALPAMTEAMAEAAPDLVLVFGADAPALAAALAASELGVPVVSGDAGLRSYDAGEAEERRRMLIDTVAGLHLVSEHSGEYNLINEGMDEESMLFAGSLRIDALRAFMEQGGAASPAAAHGLKAKGYALVIPDEEGASREAMHSVLSSLGGESELLVLLPSGSSLRSLFEGVAGVRLADLPAYGELLTLLRDASVLLQGGDELEAEATVMSVPCLTMRERTVRPSTLEIGTNVLVGLDAEEASRRMLEFLQSKPGDAHRSKIPEKWDGAAASRISAWLEERLGA